MARRPSRPGEPGGCRGRDGTVGGGQEAKAYRSEQAHIKIAAFVEQLQECELVFDADEYEAHQESPFRAFERDDAQEDRFNIFEDYLRR